MPLSTTGYDQNFSSPIRLPANICQKGAETFEMAVTFLKEIDGRLRRVFGACERRRTGV